MSDYLITTEIPNDRNHHSLLALLSCHRRTKHMSTSQQLDGYYALLIKADTLHGRSHPVTRRIRRRYDRLHLKLRFAT